MRQCVDCGELQEDLNGVECLQCGGHTEYLAYLLDFLTKVPARIIKIKLSRKRKK